MHQMIQIVIFRDIRLGFSIPKSQSERGFHTSEEHIYGRKFVDLEQRHSYYQAHCYCSNKSKSKS